MRYKDRSRLHHVTVPGGAAGADGEAAASCPEELAEMTYGGTFAEQQTSNVAKQPSIGRRCHPGLWSLERSQYRLQRTG